MLGRAQVAYLRSRAHGLKPVVRVGQRGLTDAVAAELDRALTDHELVKIRVTAADRSRRAECVDELARRTGAEVVQRIGATAALFRRNPERPRIELPAHS